MIDLRAYSHIDQLQPQTTAMIGTGSRGFMPQERQACLIVEVAPGMSINIVTDVVLKRTSVIPGAQIVERAFGSVEFHDDDQGMIYAAGDAILEYYGITMDQRLAPKLLSEQIITGLENYHSMLISRNRYGNMPVKGDTLYVMEVHPAGYAAYACNEAEKAARIQIVDLQYFGAFGRVWLCGAEEEIHQASAAIKKALDGVTGRANKGDSSVY